MTAQSASEAKDLIVLAERMGIPVDEAMRQVAHLVADVELPAARVLPETVAPAASVALAQPA
ncbi:MAG: hypothetical protein QOD72_1073 [Acidimicrobiaceae bacterium]|jgi:hypothetical protein|nr:hypothetical protein [Acidimicrobiaceae bacterium]